MTAIVWSKYNCPFCDQAKKLLESKGIQKTEEVKKESGATKALIGGTNNVTKGGQQTGGNTENKQKPAQKVTKGGHQFSMPDTNKKPAPISRGGFFI